MQRLPGGCSEAMAVGFGVVDGIEGPGMPEVLLASHICVLEGAGVSLEEHLARGEAFVEVTVALITQRLVECRDGQRQELDLAVGRRLEPTAGRSLSELVQQDTEGSGNLINRICAYAPPGCVRGAALGLDSGHIQPI